MSDIEKSEKQGDGLKPVDTTRQASVVDPVFGQISEDGPNYRNACFPLPHPTPQMTDSF